MSQSLLQLIIRKKKNIRKCWTKAASCLLDYEQPLFLIFISFYFLNMYRTTYLRDIAFYLSLFNGRIVCLCLPLCSCVDKKKLYVSVYISAFAFI